MDSLKHVLRKYAEDVCIVTGTALINVAVFQINTVFGMLVLGATFIGFGIALARRPP